ncbi:protocatechuate 4,5-dioxygenase [Streptomyces sp. NBRC 110611]|nr:protocatechuate 4,5-dioxygenase [Streptomyces sp. NBRC 110611]
MLTRIGALRPQYLEERNDLEDVLPAPAGSVARMSGLLVAVFGEGVGDERVGVAADAPSSPRRAARCRCAAADPTGEGRTAAPGDAQGTPISAIGPGRV